MLFKCFLFASLSFMACSAGWLALQTAKDEGQAASQLSSTAQAARQTLADASAALADVRRDAEIAGGVLNAVRRDVKDEKASIVAANAMTLEAMRSVADLAKHSDELVSDLDKTQASLGADIQVLADHADGAAVEVALASKQAGKALSDPNIAKSVSDLALASSRLAEASGHANKILGDGEKVADHYEKELTAPVAWWKKCLEYVLSFGADARTLFSGR